MLKRCLHMMVLLVFAWAAAGCTRESPPSGLFSFTAILGGEHTLAAGDRVLGDVYMMAGSLVVEPGATVAGSMLVLGGDVILNGAVGGEVTLLGGKLGIRPTARLAGALTIAGGELDLSPQAQVQGGVHAEQNIPVEPTGSGGGLGAALLSSLATALGIAILGYVLARYLPGPLAHVTDTIVGHPIVAAAMGMLAGITALVLLVLVAFTIVLIPFSLTGGAALLLAVAYGWTGFGMAAGQLLASRFRWRLPPAANTFIGALLFMLVLELLRFVPLVGGIIPLLTAIVGLGAVILTRFGLTHFAPAADEAPDVLPPDIMEDRR